MTEEAIIGLENKISEDFDVTSIANSIAEQIRRVIENPNKDCYPFTPIYVGGLYEHCNLMTRLGLLESIHSSYNGVPQFRLTREALELYKHLNKEGFYGECQQQ